MQKVVRVIIEEPAVETTVDFHFDNRIERHCFLRTHHCRSPDVYCYRRSSYRIRVNALCKKRFLQREIIENDAQENNEL